MFPPAQPLNLDVEAISGIFGSISIACWVVVFSPQIVENFRRGSADGLSLQFIIVWLAGDVFNILGAVLQGVLPTMIILAVYYTIADIVLLGQCFYYRGFTWRDEVAPPKPTTVEPNEHTALLEADANGNDGAQCQERERRWSNGVDVTHLSPAMPLLDHDPSQQPESSSSKRKTSVVQSLFFNLFAVLMVCAAGVGGWYISNRSQAGPRHHDKRPKNSISILSGDDALHFNLWGQIFGYMCALLYLGSRIPQILLNAKRKSTEGVSMLFFLFACIGNLTYVLSIFAFAPKCHNHDQYGNPIEVCGTREARTIYGRYILVNLSWLIGSLGTLFLDLIIFVQFFLYRRDGDDGREEEVAIGDGQIRRGRRSVDERPLLERGDSEI